LRWYSKIFDLRNEALRRSKHIGISIQTIKDWEPGGIAAFIFMRKRSIGISGFSLNSGSDADRAFETEAVSRAGGKQRARRR
jgi:hypothetical protein